MINLKRRKRQANENAGSVITMLANRVGGKEPLCKAKDASLRISDEAGLNQLIGTVEDELEDVLRQLEPDWAMPVVAEAVGKIYYGEFREYQDYGTSFKRALAYLWKSVFIQHGENKSLGKLVELLSYCFILEQLYGMRRGFWIAEEFYFSFEKGYLTVPEKFRPSCFQYMQLGAGRGKRLRVAKVNSVLMNEKIQEYYQALMDVLHGKEPSGIFVFQNTFYASIPGISDGQCKKFWQELFFRYNFYLSLRMMSDGKDLGTEIVLFPEFGVNLPEHLFTQESVDNVFWNWKWLKKQSKERYGNLIVDRPVMRISREGDFVTSAVLMGDSINNFIEKQIFHYVTRDQNFNLPQDVFRKAFSEPFEETCIQYFRGKGFLAGHVSENGTWKTQEGDIRLSAEEKIYGEVDVLAYRKEQGILILAECKVLREAEDTRAYKNLVAKLKDDSEGFRAKLTKKGAWIAKAFRREFGVEIAPERMILTDIPLPVIGLEGDIVYTSFPRLAYEIDRACESFEI